MPIKPYIRCKAKTVSEIYPNPDHSLAVHLELTEEQAEQYAMEIIYDFPDKYLRMIHENLGKYLKHVDSVQESND